MRTKFAALVLVLFSVPCGEARLQLKSNSSGAISPQAGRDRGRILFENHCAACHQSDGKGGEDEAPPLAGSPWVSGSDVRLIKIVLHGMRGPVKVGDKIFNREMPGFGQILSDAQLASLLSFVRRQWSKSAAPITPKTVSGLRTATRGRQDYWTVKELLQEP